MQEAIRQPISARKPFDLCRLSRIDDEREDFIREIAYRMGCGLLPDVNNVFVSAVNPGFSAIDYLAHFPLFRVGGSRSRVPEFGRNKACGPAMCFEAQQSGEP
jgi:hypothetical protein